MNKKSPTKFDSLSEDQRKTIVQMFHSGNGPQFICSRLKLPSGLIERYLKSLGLSRTREESKKAKSNCYPEHLLKINR